MSKRVLMVAYHFPPIHLSSGIQRTLAFARYLPEFGWEPSVLTVHPRAYPAVSDSQMAQIPPGLRVERAFGLDTARHLQIAGRYPGFLAVPDRWATWRLGAVSTGMRMIRELRPQVLWTTYPIATAVQIGLGLKRRGGLPWVADFRDPMTDVNYPRDAHMREIWRGIERQAVESCQAAVLTTPGAVDLYRTRYPQLPGGRFHLIENGYDESSFQGLAPAPRAAGGRLVLVHSGTLYPSERDPNAFFEALAMLKARGLVDAGRLELRLRATGHDDFVRELLARYDIADLVSVVPSIPYREALQEMMDVDGLLILQAANCNQQVPAKLYEYLRAGRPIVALTDPAGDTAATLRGVGVDRIAPLDSAPAIADLLARVLDELAGPAPRLPGPEAVAAASRRGRAESLARLLDQLSGA